MRFIQYTSHIKIIFLPGKDHWKPPSHPSQRCKNGTFIETQLWHINQTGWRKLISKFIGIKTVTKLQMHFSNKTTLSTALFFLLKSQEKFNLFCHIASKLNWIFINISVFIYFSDFKNTIKLLASQPSIH